MCSIKFVNMNIPAISASLKVAILVERKVHSKTLVMKLQFFLCCQGYFLDVVERKRKRKRQSVTEST